MTAFRRFHRQRNDGWEICIKNIRTALSETEKKSLYFTGLIHKNSEKRAKILKNRKKITLNQRKKRRTLQSLRFFMT